MTQQLTRPVIPVMRPVLGEEEAVAVAEAVRSGWVAQGPRVAAFEAAFAARVGAAEGVALSSCTTALHLALHVLDVGPGDEVVLPSLSFIATANAVRYCGATPVFADVDLTGNLTPATVEAALTPSTRAILLVHQAGVPVDVPAIAAVARGLPIVEDAACAAGSVLHGRPVGAGALLAAWSFHPRKLITTGEGGMLTTDDPGLAARLRRLREHGMSVSAAERHVARGRVLETYDEVGFNYRMTDIQAALGLVQLGRLDEIVARRRALAGSYHDLLAAVPGLTTVRDPVHGLTNYQSFWVLLDDDVSVDRDTILRRLAEDGIAGRRGIMAAHLERAYSDPPRHSLPTTERLTRRSLILPLHHDLALADQEYVVVRLASSLSVASPRRCASR